MNKSCIRDQFATSSVNSDEIVVANSFVHPSRGPVRCSAALAVAASLHAKYRTVRIAELTLAPDPAGISDATVFCVSYLDPRGDVAGIAVAARRDDVAALATAEDAVGRWAAVLRTRRALIAATDPVCDGAHRATALAAHALAGDHGQATLLGQWPTDGRATELLVRSAPRATDLDAVPDADTVVLAAHGASLATRAEAAARGLRIVDATCPLVTDAQTTVRAFADRGDTVLLVGRPEHAVTAGLVGQAPEHVRVVSSVDVAATIRIADPDAASFVVSPGTVVEEATTILAALRSRFPRLRGQHPDGWCYAAADRLTTIRSVAAEADLLLILGPPDAADTRTLAALASAMRPTRTLASARELRPDWLRPAATIGIVPSATAVPALTEQVVAVLSGLGPLSVAHRHVHTEVHAGQRHQSAPVDGRPRADVAPAVADR